MEEKLGSCFVLRRGARPYSLLSWLVHSAQIVSLLSSVLTDILNSFEIRMPKMTTKNAKIRKLLSLQEISDTCTQEEVDKIEAMLIAQEQKRNSKKEAELDEDPKDDEQDMFGASHVLSGFCCFLQSPLFRTGSAGRN